MAIKVTVRRHKNRAGEGDRVTLAGKQGVLTKCVNCSGLFIQEDIHTAIEKSSPCECQVKRIRKVRGLRVQMFKKTILER